MMTNNSLSVKHQFGTYSRKKSVRPLGVCANLRRAKDAHSHVSSRWL